VGQSGETTSATRAKLEEVRGGHEAIGPTLAQKLLIELNKGETDDPGEASGRGRAKVALPRQRR
jgi:hypothetical protein